MAVRAMNPWTASALAGSLLLAACSGGSGADDETAPGPSAETLAVMVAQADDLSAVSATLKDAGLAQVFDGTGSYTLLAPQDGAVVMHDQ